MQLKKRAKATLESISQEAGRAQIIHYACHTFQHESASNLPPRIVSIAARNLYDDSLECFSIWKEATALGLSKPSKIRNRLDEFELAMIENFYSKQIPKQNYQTLLWDERSHVFGLEAIANRYRALGGSHADVPNFKSVFSLKSLLADVYGHALKASGMMKTLGELNSFDFRDFIDGSAEGKLARSNHLRTIDPSVICKTELMRLIFSLHIKNNLVVTEDSWTWRPSWLHVPKFTFVNVGIGIGILIGLSGLFSFLTGFTNIPQLVDHFKDKPAMTVPSSDFGKGKRALTH